jgi:N utilization substance protein B
MLGRRHFRVKVLQSLYAFFQGGEPRIQIAEKNLLKSVEMVYQLFCLEYSFFFEVMHFYESRMEDAKNKFYPTDEELNPSTKLLQNRLLKVLTENEHLEKEIRNYSISWTQEQEMVRKTVMKMKSSKELLAYLNSGKDSIEEDRSILIKLFRKHVANNSDLYTFCEERDIHWHDDFDVVSGFAIKALMIIPEDFSPQSQLYQLFSRDNEEETSEGEEFLKQLFNLTVLHSGEFEKLIEERTRNWEIDRIALTDVIILKMALTELLFFPHIPVKVTLNEYIEISKHFSTQKSKQFINGILDKLVTDLSEQDRIKKTGRGLIQ